MSLETIGKRIEEIKQGLSQIGDMRPGSLSKQYNVCGVASCSCKNPKSPKKHGPYYQLSYVHRGKSTTRFVRRNEVKTVKTQLANYKRFRKLTELWIRLALEHTEIITAQARATTQK